MAKSFALICVLLLECILFVQSMRPLPVEDECQPKSKVQTVTAKVKSDCNKCCIAQKQFFEKDERVKEETSCIKYSGGLYTTLAGETPCFCQSDFARNCTVNVCQPATRRANGSSVKLSRGDIATNDKNCKKCCMAQVVPNIGMACPNPTMFVTGDFQTSDNKCWCKWSSELETAAAKGAPIGC